MRSGTFIALALFTLSLTLVLVPLLLAAGSRAAREVALRERPLCVWVGRPIIRGQITPTRLAELRESLRTQLGATAEQVREHPFDEIDAGWLMPGPGERREVRFSGRTLAEDDPLWGRMQLQRGRAPHAGEAGVVVSRGMLETLIEGSELPETLPLVLSNNQTLRVPLLGVVDEKQLPSGHAFAFDPVFEWSLRQADPDPVLREITTGPISPELIDVEKLPEDTRTALERTFSTFHVQWPPEPVPDIVRRQDRWRLRSEDSVSITKVEWGLTLKKIAQRLNDLGHLVPEEFIAFQAPDLQPAPQKRESWGRLTLAVEDPALLPRVALAAQAVDLPTYDVVLRQMEEIDRESRVWAWANLGIGAAVTLIAGGMLMLFIRSRVQGQRAQLGMLKAMGASGAMIVEIGLREVVALWCLGLLGAVVLACGITLVVGSSLGWTSSVWRQFSLPWLGIVLASLGGLIVGVLSSLWATWGVSKEPPINLIRRTP
jgi:hypothetical protein